MSSMRPGHVWSRGPRCSSGTRVSGAGVIYVRNVIYAGAVIYASRLDHLGIGVVIKPGHIRGAALANAAAVDRALVGDLAGIERGRFSQHQRASDRPRRGSDAAVH